MKKTWINTIENWHKDFDNWDIDYRKGVIEIMYVIHKPHFDITSGEIKVSNIKNVIEESAELIFQLKNGQSVSFLGYNPKVNFYVTP
jgi:hypothetical protein